MKSQESKKSRSRPKFFERKPPPPSFSIVSVEVTGGDLVVRIKPRKQAGDEFTEVEVEVMHASLRGEKVLSPGELQDFNTAADDPHQVYDVTLPNPQPTVIKNTIVALDTIVTVDGVSWEAGQTFSARPS